MLFPVGEEDVRMVRAELGSMQHNEEFSRDLQEGFPTFLPDWPVKECLTAVYRCKQQMEIRFCKAVARTYSLHKAELPRRELHENSPRCERRVRSLFNYREQPA